MIAWRGPASCVGCGVPVIVWHDGLRHVIRDYSVTWSPVHLCAEPEQRERIDLDHYERLAGRDRLLFGSWALAMMADRCPRCGDRDVALSTWGRLVDFPSSPDAEGWAEAWVGPLSEHVCGLARHERITPRPVWEAFGR